MSRWRREKHRRETAILQSFRDKLAYGVARLIEKGLIEGGQLDENQRQTDEG